MDIDVGSILEETLVNINGKYAGKVTGYKFLSDEKVQQYLAGSLHTFKPLYELMGTAQDCRNVIGSALLMFWEMGRLYGRSELMYEIGEENK